MGITYFEDGFYNESANELPWLYPAGAENILWELFNIMTAGAPYVAKSSKIMALTMWRAYICIFCEDELN